MPGRRPGLHFPAGSPLRATLPGHRRTRNYSPACRTAASPGKPRRSATEGVGAGGCLRACTPAGPRADDFLRALPPSGPLTRRTTTPPPAGPRADDFLRALPPSGPLTRRTTTPPPAGPQRHRVSSDGLPLPGRGRTHYCSPLPGRGRTSFAGAASRTTDEAHNDSPTRRAAASPGKLRRAAFSGPRADALLLPSSEPRANGFSGLPRLPGHPIGLRPGIHSGWTDRRRTRNYAPPPGRRRGTRNYFPACRACSASRSSRTRRGMPTAERSRMWVSGLRIHAVSGLPGSTR